MSGGPDVDVLLADDDNDLREALATGLAIAGYSVVEARNGQQAVRLVASRTVGIVVSDIRMPMLDGRQLLQRVREIDAELPVILITGHADIDQAVDAVRGGAHDFLAKPFASERLREAVDKALGMRRLVLENRSLRSAIEAAGVDRRLPLIGTSPAITAILRSIERIGSADVNILVEGERGTGKNRIAQYLSGAGSGQPAAAQVIDCEIMSEKAIDQRLFGAATPGARTLVIANVERLPLPVQARLVHALQRQDEQDRSGSDAPRGLRIISTSSLSLPAQVDQGRVRADLYFRLAPVRLEVPPLRERREDIPMLFARLVGEAAALYRRPVPPLSDAVLARLTGHDWPGNLIELRSFAEQCVLNLERAEAGPGREEGGLAERVARFEREAIVDALRRSGGDVAQTCRRLGVPRKTMYDKINRYGIDLGALRKAAAGP
jgi:two-component system, NtrC family, C4-dicarboxylate transport response regulator DctD